MAKERKQGDHDVLKQLQVRLEDPTLSAVLKNVNKNSKPKRIDYLMRLATNADLYQRNGKPKSDADIEKWVKKHPRLPNDVADLVRYVTKPGELAENFKRIQPILAKTTTVASKRKDEDNKKRFDEWVRKSKQYSGTQEAVPAPRNRFAERKQSGREEVEELRNELREQDYFKRYTAEEKDEIVKKFSRVLPSGRFASDAVSFLYKPSADKIVQNILRRAPEKRLEYVLRLASNRDLVKANGERKYTGDKLVEYYKRNPRLSRDMLDIINEIKNMPEHLKELENGVRELTRMPKELRSVRRNTMKSKMNHDDGTVFAGESIPAILINMPPETEDDYICKVLAAYRQQFPSPIVVSEVSALYRSELHTTIISKKQIIDAIFEAHAKAKVAYKLSVSLGLLLSVPNPKYQEGNGEPEDILEVCPPQYHVSTHTVLHVEEDTDAKGTYQVHERRRGAPVLISNRRDIEKYCKDISIYDTLSSILSKTSEIDVFAVPCMKIAMSFTDIPMGAVVTIPPDFEKDTNFIHNKFAWKENLCLFSAIAIAKDITYGTYTKDKMYLAEAKRLYFKHYGIKFKPGVYKGTSPSEYDAIEKSLNISINVYRHDLEFDKVLRCRTSQLAPTAPTPGGPGLVPLVPALGAQEETTEETTETLEVTPVLNAFAIEDDEYGHLMVIKNAELVSKAVICEKCGNIYPNEKNYVRHMGTCIGPGFHYKFNKGEEPVRKYENKIKIQMKDLDLDLDWQIPQVAFFDFESILAVRELAIDGTAGAVAKTRITSDHVPVSVAVADNIGIRSNPAALRKRFFCIDEYDNDPYRMVTAMAEYFIELSKESFEENSVYFKPATDRMGEDTREKFLGCLKQLTVCGFNSGRYDMNLIKSYGILQVLKKDNIGMIAKACNNYICQSSDHLKILDLMNYCPAGTSYEQLCRTFIPRSKASLAFPYSFVTSMESFDHEGVISREYFKACSDAQYDAYISLMSTTCTTLCDYAILYDSSGGKSVFPYEFMSTADVLSFSDVIPMSAFNSKLRNTVCSPEDYSEYLLLRAQGKADTLRDLLKYYNECDVVPALKVIEKMQEFYKERGFDMFQDAITLPKLAELTMFNSMHDSWVHATADESCTHESCTDSDTKLPEVASVSSRVDWYRRMDKKASRECTLSATDVLEILQRDRMRCTHCLSQLQPVQFANGVKVDDAECWSMDRIDNAIGHTADNCITACTKCNKARSSTSVSAFRRKLASQQHTDANPNMVYVINEANKEIYYILKAGMTGGASTVFCRYQEEGKSHISRTVYNEETNEWSVKQGELCKRVLGFDANALYLWTIGQEMPCGKLRLQKENLPAIETFNQEVLSGERFGFAEVDIHVPKHLWSKFAEWCPLYVNKVVTDDLISDTSKQIRGNKKNSKIKKLLTVLQAEKIMLYTPLIKWYLEHGLVITRIHSIITASRGRPFKSFEDWVSDSRRAGDQNSANAILADMAKLIGNSAFGRTIYNKEKQSVVKLLESKKEARQKVNKHNFNAINVIHRCNEVKMALAPTSGSMSAPASVLSSEYASASSTDADSCAGTIYEVMSGKTSAQMDRPVQIGLAIFQLSKLRMLQFYYDCLTKYVDPVHFQMIESDTDSMYMAFADSPVPGHPDDLLRRHVRPEMKEEFDADVYNWFPDTRTKESAAYTKRVPGLFKVEATGKGMVALCSKSYYLLADSRSKDKLAGKGCQMKKNADIANFESYKRCLDQRVIIEGKNTGFRVVDNKMITYTCTKSALNAYYDKRFLMEDGINTRPVC